MAETNQIFYMSLVVGKMKVFVHSPNCQLNNYIPVLLCSYFLIYHQFFVKFLWHNSAFGLRLIFNSLLLKVVHKFQYTQFLNRVNLL